MKKKYTQQNYHTKPSNQPQSFICKSCGAEISLEGAGSQHRNHCPHCLCSVHLDNAPGDRAVIVAALWKPLAVWVRSNENGLCCIAVKNVVSSTPIALQPTIIF